MNTIEKRARLESLRKEAAQLEEQISREERGCSHVYGEAEYDPIESPRMEFDHYEGHGSDPNPVYRRAGTNTTPRWKQTCQHCGKVRYTQKTKPVGMVPDFDH